MTQRGAERATERVAVLMTPTEKAAYVDRASSLGLSLGSSSAKQARPFEPDTPSR